MIIDNNKLLQIFNDNDLEYNIYNHPPLNTVEESKKMRGKIESL